MLLRTVETLPTMPVGIGESTAFLSVLEEGEAAHLKKSWEVTARSLAFADSGEKTLLGDSSLPASHLEDVSRLFIYTVDGTSGGTLHLF